jgi:hypothetical protein
MRVVKGQRARREKEPEARTTKGRESVDAECEAAKTQFQSQSQHAPVGLSLKGKRMETTRQ